MKLDELYRALREEMAAGHVSVQTENAFWGGVTLAFRSMYRRRGFSWPQIDELAQRSVLVVYRKLSKFEPKGPDGFTKWVKEIARREARKHRDQANKRQIKMDAIEHGMPEATPMVTPSTWTLERERRDVVAKLQPELTTPQREAIEYPDHFALAEARGLTVDAAKKRWDRAVVRLRKAWASFRNTSRLSKITPT